MFKWPCCWGNFFHILCILFVMFYEIYCLISEISIGFGWKCQQVDQMNGWCLNKMAVDLATVCGMGCRKSGLEFGPLG